MCLDLTQTTTLAVADVVADVVATVATAATVADVGYYILLINSNGNGSIKSVIGNSVEENYFPLPCLSLT